MDKIMHFVASCTAANHAATFQTMNIY